MLWSNNVGQNQEKSSTHIDLLYFELIGHGNAFL